MSGISTNGSESGGTSISVIDSGFINFMERRVAVLMTCHNRAEITLRSLACLEQAALGMQIDVFLVDDGSTDGTGDRVKAKYPNVNVTLGDGNLYWAKGMHLAWQTASKRCDYDFYLWLNDDLQLKPGAITGLFADYEMVKSVVVGACSEDVTEASCSYGVSDARDKKISPNGSPQQATGWFNGNFVLVPKSVYNKIGMISPEYSHARADYDYAERLKKAHIPFYCSSRYVGVCPNDFSAKIHGMNILQRLCLLRRPGYWNLHDLWRIKSQYHGNLAAVLSCLHLMCVAVKGV